MKYRAEVDGLRTIAVVPVVLFHAGLSVFSGGYVGVDVFFVISGYLITGILADEMAEGRFSLVKFYERRARRILPALFVVMAACLPFAWMWMLPSEMLNFSRSLVAVSLFASNVLFYLQAGYFAPNAEAFPLLHTWSLAVEEQFYIFFPLLLLALGRLGRRPVMLILGVLSLISLALCHLLITSQPNATFYLIHTRAWELFAGALVALWQRRHGARVQGSNEILAALGLGMVLWSIFMFDKATPFPSLWTVLPVGGTALLLLFASPGTWVARGLSLKPMVWIGLISYSAYLVHQPLFAFARIRSIGEPDHLLMYGLAALTFPLAWISWRFVEQPFRKPQNKGGFGRNAIFAGSMAGLAAFVGVGGVGHVMRGVPDRVPDSALQLLAHRSDVKRIGDCSGIPNAPLDSQKACIGGDPDSVHLVAVIGDSHNGALAWNLPQKLQDAGYAFYEVSRAKCWPFTGFLLRDDPGFSCDAHNAAVLAQIDALKGDRSATLVLSSRWSLNLLGTRFNNGEGGVEPAGVLAAAATRDWPNAIVAGDPARIAAVKERLLAALEEILDTYRVVLIYQVPEVGWNLPDTAAKGLLYKSERDFSTSYQVYKERNSDVAALFDGIEHPNLYRVRPEKVFCDTYVADRCVTVLDGKSLYRDDDHLSQAGAALLSEEILKVIAAIPLEPQ